MFDNMSAPAAASMSFATALRSDAYTMLRGGIQTAAVIAVAYTTVIVVSAALFGAAHGAKRTYQWVRIKRAEAKSAASPFYRPLDDSEVEQPEYQAAA